LSSESPFLGLDITPALILNMSLRSLRPTLGLSVSLPLGLCAGLFGAAISAAPLPVPGANASDVVLAAPVFTSQLGGRGTEQALAVATDSQGYLFVAGWTSSTDFPTTPEAMDERVQERDAFVAKVSPDGETLVWSTVLGGSRDEEALTIQVDAAGVVLVGGWTNSNDFPVTDTAHGRSRFGSKDGFLTALDPSGGSILFSGYIGGSGHDAVTDIALTLEGDIVLAGWTESRDLPTSSNVFQPSFGGDRDAFFMRVDESGFQLRFVSYLGGRGMDEAVGVALDQAGYIVVAGTTESRDFPVTSGALDAKKNGKDVFVTRLTPEGKRLSFSTFYGGSGDEIAHALDLAPDGGVVVVGSTRSSDLPVKGSEGLERTGHGDGFVLHLSNSGGALVFARYLGGSSDDNLGAVATDSLGGLWVGGHSNSDDFGMTAGASQPLRAGANDAVLVRLDAVTGVMQHGTFLGGKGDEEIWGMVADSIQGGVTFAGFAQRTETTTRGQFAGRGGASDGYFGRLVPGDCGVPAMVVRMGSVNGLPLDSDFPRLGKTIDLVLSGAPAGTPGILFLGVPVASPLVSEELGTIYIDLVGMAVLSAFNTNASGAGSVRLHIPVSPELCGLELVVQGLIDNHVTDAVQLTLGS
jgi:hypothetical protein